MTGNDYEQHAISVLRSKKFRITMTRIMVIRVLSKAEKVMNAYSIHEAILSERGQTDVVSVYRILDTLAECKLVRSVSVLRGFIRATNPDSALLVDVAAGTAVEQDIPPKTISSIKAMYPADSENFSFNLELIKE